MQRRISEVDKSHAVAVTFRDRLKVERERRGWTQVEMVERLKACGVNMLASALAKVEAGDRAVKVHEASAIADCFGVSVDSLMGRKAGVNDLAYTLRSMQHAAGQGAVDIKAIYDTTMLWGLDLMEDDFTGIEHYHAEGVRALKALSTAEEALQRISMLTLKPKRQAGKARG